MAPAEVALLNMLCQKIDGSGGFQDLAVFSAWLNALFAETLPEPRGMTPVQVADSLRQDPLAGTRRRPPSASRPVSLASAAGSAPTLNGCNWLARRTQGVTAFGLSTTW